MVIMGVINNLPRVKTPPRTRRANSRIGFTDADQVVVTGVLSPPLFIGTASSDLPASPTPGQVVVLSNAESAGPALCMFYGGSWWFANSSELS